MASNTIWGWAGVWIAPLVTALATACAPAGATGAGGQSGAGGDGPTVAEQSAADHGGDSSTSLGQMLAVSDSIFDFDPTLDPTKTAAQNAAAIEAAVTAALGGCGSATLSGTTVTVSFGPPPGCTLTNGVTVSGSASAAVSTSGQTVTVALTLTDLVAGGKALSGTATFATTNGTTFAVTADLTTSSATDTEQLTIAGAAGSFTINGAATSAQATGTSSYTYTGVVWTPGQCYPSAGTMKIVTGAVSLTFAFSSTTPTTGKVTVTAGKRTYPLSLPAYGSCPPDGG